MNLKSQKGYSLIEIGVGLVILIIFLWCSNALFNGSYNTYRMIQQRNIATNYAVSTLEKMLQTDADILTGYFIEELDSATNQYVIKPNPELIKLVRDEFELFKERYEMYFPNGEITDKKIEEYLIADKEHAVPIAIEEIVQDMEYDEKETEEVLEGNYAMLTPNVVQEGSLTTMANENNMIIRKTISRLPINEWRAYGNQILKLKVEVFYTPRIDNHGITEEDLKSITLETIKVTNKVK